MTCQINSNGYISLKINGKKTNFDKTKYRDIFQEVVAYLDKARLIDITKIVQVARKDVITIMKHIEPQWSEETCISVFDGMMRRTKNGNKDVTQWFKQVTGFEGEIHATCKALSKEKNIDKSNRHYCFLSQGITQPLSTSSIADITKTTKALLSIIKTERTALIDRERLADMMYLKIGCRWGSGSVMLNTILAEYVKLVENEIMRIKKMPMCQGLTEAELYFQVNTIVYDDYLANINYHISEALQKFKEIRLNNQTKQAAKQAAKKAG